jgi:hypothetical protein
MQAGKVTPGIDMCYSLSEVPDAFPIWNKDMRVER